MESGNKLSGKIVLLMIVFLIIGIIMIFNGIQAGSYKLESYIEYVFLTIGILFFIMTVGTFFKMKVAWHIGIISAVLATVFMLYTFFATAYPAKWEDYLVIISTIATVITLMGAEIKDYYLSE